MASLFCNAKLNQSSHGLLIESHIVIHAHIYYAVFLHFYQTLPLSVVFIASYAPTSTISLLLYVVYSHHRMKRIRTVDIFE